MFAQTGLCVYVQASYTLHNAIEHDSTDEEVWFSLLARNFPGSTPAFPKSEERVSYKRLLQLNVEVFNFIALGKLPSSGSNSALDTSALLA